MSLSRRTVLRGIGVTMALPWMESLTAWETAANAIGPSPKRFALLFMGNGINGNHWWAKGSGAAMKLSKSLAPLEPLKHKIIVVNGLFNKPSVGMGIHPAQTGNLLSGVPVQQGPVVRSGVTVDQVIANHVGRETPHASLVLGCERPMTGWHETNFSMIYSSHISWRSASSPIAAQIVPSMVFDRLFENRGRLHRSSVLDRVNDRASSLARSVSTGDKARLDEYLTSVREIERRIEPMRDVQDKVDDSAVRKVRPVSGMERPAQSLPDDLREHARLMCDLIALAFQTDTTRVATLLLARDLSSLEYPFLDVREPHHSASHDDLSDAYERISRFHLGQLGYLAAKLDAMPEGEGTVLDHCCLIWLSNMWAGWKHDNMKLPVVLAGGLGGTLPTGRALDYLYAGDEHRKLCSLYLSIMDRMGVKRGRFGDADKGLPGL